MSMTATSSIIDYFAENAHFGDTFRQRRIDLWLTQSELARFSGVSQADISRIENHQLDARGSTFHRLAVVLNDSSRAPKRSLANGSQGPAPKLTGKPPWRPTSPVLALQKS